MIKFTIVHPDATEEHLGLLPSFFDEADPRPAREQLDDRYAHGGGFKPFTGFIINADSIKYPGDPHPRPLLAVAKLRDETIRLYDGAWVCIEQADGRQEITRVD